MDSYQNPYMGRKDDRFEDALHGDLPYDGDPIYDPYAPRRTWEDKREAADDIPFVGDPQDPDNPDHPDDDPPVPNRAWTEM